MASSPQPGLLHLPPELRVTIFEYVLVSRDPIRFVDHITPPALLQINRLIRTESHPIWHQKNTFLITVANCDPSMVLKYEAYERLIPGHVMQCTMRPIGRPHWANLVKWVHMVLARRCGGMTVGESPLDASLVVAAAHEHARQVRSMGGNGQELEALLGTLRKVAGRLDARWLEDRYGAGVRRRRAMLARVGPGQPSPKPAALSYLAQQTVVSTSELSRSNGSGAVQRIVSGMALTLARY